jgi:hypothetical protein
VPDDGGGLNVGGADRLGPPGELPKDGDVDDTGAGAGAAPLLVPIGAGETEPPDGVVAVVCPKLGAAGAVSTRSLPDAELAPGLVTGLPEPG